MNIFIKSMCAALGAFALCAGNAAAQAAEETPIVTFRTNIYNEYGETNSFHIVLGATEPTYFDIDYGFGTEEILVDVAYFDQEAQGMHGTPVKCRVSEEGIVRIYGDASKLDYFDAEGCYIEWIDLDQCTNLEILDLQHNELKGLDLTPFTKLSAIYLTDNPFSAESPLIVGPNKPNLMILEIDITEHIDQSFNLSDYPAMVSFDAYHCRDLKTIDPTGCPELQSLSLELTDVATVDVSQNTKLRSLNVSDSRVTSLDLSNNPNLINLLAEHVSGNINTDVKVQGIDLSNNPNLVLLFLGGNDLTAIDLSNNPYLSDLNLKRNKLSTIDLTANTNLYSVNLSYNDFTYATLPLPDANWGEYYYYRSPLPCDRSYPVGGVIDLAGSVLREGTTTTVKVWRQPVAASHEEVEESAYSYADGKISFNQAFADSVYVEYINSAFPDYTLSSSAFMVKTAEEFGLPTPMVAFRPSSVAAGGVKMGVSVCGASAAAPRTIHVKCGNGEEKTYAVTSDDIDNPTMLTIAEAAAAQDVVISIEEADLLTSLYLSDQPLSSLDVTAAVDLQVLSVKDCSLRSIDLQFNKRLELLDLSGNRLGNLSLTGPNDSFEKNLLHTLNVEHNQLYNIEIMSRRYLMNLDMSDNRFTTFDFTNFDNLRNLDMSNNRVAGVLSLTYLGLAETIDLHNNSIDSLTLAEMPALQLFDISDNKMSIRTMPLAATLPAGCAFTYAPQKEYTILDKAPGINLSSQYRVIDGQSTTFVWKKADGTVLQEGVDIACNNGATRFLNTSLGQVYCEMAHPAFPALSGTDAFRTTLTLVVDAPTNVIATFTCKEGTDNGSVILRAKEPTAIYIDWRGDGTDYVQYEVASDDPSEYVGQTAYAGAVAKVYTYGSADELTVFDIIDVPLSSIDASPLTSLLTFAVDNAGLDKENITMPASPTLKNVRLSGNRLFDMTFENYPNLIAIDLTYNQYESFDASLYSNLEVLSLGNNELTEVSFDNPAMWGFEAGQNKLESIDLNGLPAIHQLYLADNQLSSIDLSPVTETLTVLDISSNKFRFSTLPDISGMLTLNKFYYANQAPIEVECVDGCVDLSAEAKVDDVATQFYWFLGEVYVDPENGGVVGEMLEGTGDDPEYTVTNGITGFHYTFSDKVTGLLLNEAYPNLGLFTKPFDVDSTVGIVDAKTELDADAIVDVFTVSGLCVRRGVRAAEALNGLDKGIYIVGARKVYVAR